MRRANRCTAAITFYHNPSCSGQCNRLFSTVVALAFRLWKKSLPDIERRHLRRSDAHDEESKEPHQRHRHGHHGRESRCTQRFEEIDEALHVSQPGPNQPGKNCPVYGYCPVKIGTE